MSEFELDPRLATDSVLVAEGPLSQVRLMNDERYPWLILVPRLAGITEWIDLDGDQQDKLRTELNRACKALNGTDGVEKINIGALGNIVRQLHFHVIGRHVGDPAWPGPVWGQGQAHRFDPEVLAERVAHWKERLGYSPQP
ncbi:HIT domain-containing protein [Stenotrophomonas rhizophila]|uniref:HIT domain-containing protein n=1 Tax=Stenotrophomonas rhizophila TaxID=216778 RepID=UPI0010C05980|nr:HIT family protein [Stenotrophomonas rhizophila]TKK03049.1 diadenosine tetraphosphate hydrolase [Stenotrophomonas rhizophila]